MDTHKRDGYLAARTVHSDWSPPAHDGALAEALRAYLGHFGPAGVDDIGKFLGESRVAPIRSALAALGDEIVPVLDQDGRAMVDLAAAPRPAAISRSRFGCCRSSTVSRWPTPRPTEAGRCRRPTTTTLIKTANGQVLATVLVDGFVAGTWTVGRPIAPSRSLWHPWAVGPRASAPPCGTRPNGSVRSSPPRTKSATSRCASASLSRDGQSTTAGAEVDDELVDAARTRLGDQCRGGCQPSSSEGFQFSPTVCEPANHEPSSGWANLACLCLSQMP